MNPLSALHCKPLEGHAAMGADEIAAHLAKVPGWALVNGAVQKRFSFPDYYQTIAFVNAVAWIANSEDHHPELQVSYDHCTVRFNTHSVKGISLNDFICAAKLDALLP